MQSKFVTLIRGFFRGRGANFVPPLSISFFYVANKAKLHSNTPRFSIPNQTVHYQIFTCIYTDTCMPPSRMDISIFPPLSNFSIKKTCMEQPQHSDTAMVKVCCPSVTCSHEKAEMFSPAVFFCPCYRKALGLPVDIQNNTVNSVHNKQIVRPCNMCLVVLPISSIYIIIPVTLPVYCFRLPSYAYLLFQAPT
jgi:hypothetical protein